jgi:DNA-binding response OmpR family regulator
MTASNNSILIVDPDPELASQLSDDLSQEGYNVISVNTGREAMAQLQYIHDLIILDPLLPDMNGLDFLRAIKQRPELSSVPVFILSTKGTEADEIISLEVGADDYITKPVQTPRFKARIKALFRRQEQRSSLMTLEEDVILIDELSINIPQFSVARGREHIEFSKKEFEILVHLAKNHGRVMTRQVLFHIIWGHRDSSANRTIDVHIGRIRKKLKGYAHYIETVSGIGYRFHA